MAMPLESPTSTPVALASRCSNRLLVQMEDEIIGAQARHIAVGVETLRGSSKSLVRKIFSTLVRLRTWASQSD